VCKEGLLIVLSGPSGTGKGTICAELLKILPDINLSISSTTRVPRKNEVEGINYFFLTKEKFIEMKNNEEFLETAEVYDNYYGTPKKYVLDKLELGKDIILEIDINGAMQVKKNYSRGIFIFIVPPSLAELKSRIKNRATETEEVMQKRLNSAKGELECYQDYDYVVINDNLDKAVGLIKSIILTEKAKAKQMEQIMEHIISGGDYYE
jgi:guanylate kinase